MATELLQKTQKLVFQKNQWKMETFKTHNEQNNDHTEIIQKIQFRSSFKGGILNFSEFNGLKFYMIYSYFQILVLVVKGI